MQPGAEVTQIEASRRGDRDAFARIIERYQRAVYAVAFSGVRDRALADDVAQDTFVIAWRRLDELRDERRLAAWLCGIARNRARELRRQSHRETASEIGDVVHATTPYDAMTEAELERIVVAALDQVPAVYREPLVLYYYEERSIDDVARSLGISPATTNKRLSRGRRYLAERVATVERGLVRRGPSPGLAASVLAVIAVTLPASHVDASPAVAKGSTMHKLALVATVTAAVGGAVALVVTTTRNDAHAEPRRAVSSPTAGADHAQARAASAHEDHGGALCGLMASLQRHAPTPAAANEAGAVAASADRNDCAAVGEHLADLQADATHGPDHRPEQASLDACGSTYRAMCEAESWSAERRSCVIAASDLINAHLCAGQVTPSNAAPTSVPPDLACGVIGPRVASVLQAGGFHEDVTDLPQQIESACDLGTWSIELRTCFAAATTIDALKACVTPDSPTH